MLTKSPTGTWLPAWVPQSSITVCILLILCSIVQSATGGYDGSMLNGNEARTFTCWLSADCIICLNILPSYNKYFRLNSATTGLNTASVFIGGTIGPFLTGPACDRLGRRPVIFWGSVVTLVGIVLQTAAQNVAMFVVARIVLGFGNIISGISAGVYLSETFASRYRAWGVGLLNDFYYVGALLAAGITLGTGQWQNTTWAWRAPTLFQAIFSVLCIVVLPFVPESPRWLVSEGLFDAARLSVAQANAHGDINDPVTLAVYKEIVDTIKWEKENRTMTPIEIAKNPVARKRLLIGMSAGPFSCIAGNIIASYYLGPELDTAGITEYVAQLKANVVLNVWCLFTSLVGTHLCYKWGRKPTALLAQCLLVICLFIIGGLSKIYADNGTATSQGVIYGDVAVIFLFQGFYSIAWTPLLYLYPPEVMNYSIRANGLAFSQFMLNAFAVVLVFVMPIGLNNIGWKMYMVNGGWDVIVIFLIAYYWVETKGLTLEEVDAIFEGHKHSNVPDVELVRTGKETLNVKAVEQELEKETVEMKAA